HGDIGGWRGILFGVVRFCDNGGKERSAAGLGSGTGEGRDGVANNRGRTRRIQRSYEKRRLRPFRKRRSRVFRSDQEAPRLPSSELWRGPSGSIRSAWEFAD